MCSAISVPTCWSVFIWKCVAPIQDFIVPKGCSTVWRRRRILAGVRSSRLHSLKDGFVLPTGDPPLLACCALAFQRAGLTGSGPISTQCLTLFLIGVVIG